MLAKPQVGSANVAVTIGDRDYVLVPTLAAAQGISRLSGGLRGAIDAVIKIDLDVITAVVRFGLGPKVVREIGVDQLAKEIWQAGMTDTGGELAAKCIEYLSILINGGRPLKREESSDENPSIS